MTSITVLVPTRDRPANAYRLLVSMDETSTLATTEVVMVLDRTAPLLREYFKFLKPILGKSSVIPFIGVGNMVDRTNAAALTFAPHADIIGWAADDNLFKTEGWDAEIAKEFEDPNCLMVDTNDLLVGDQKSSVVFVRSDVVQKLGYFYLPTCQHLYVDFAMNELFKAAGAYRYREDIIIEHLHPYASKAEWDEAYARYNTPMQDSMDGRAFSLWRKTGFEYDVAKIKELIS